MLHFCMPLDLGTFWYLFNSQPNFEFHAGGKKAKKFTTSESYNTNMLTVCELSD